MDFLQQQRVERVWRERATRLSQRPVLTRSGQDLPVIVLGVGNEQYAIDLADVAEVLPLVRTTPVPGAPSVFSGVINAHGEIRPVLNLRRFLGLESIQDGGLVRVLLLRNGGRELGLEIESVEKIRRIESGELQVDGRGVTGRSQKIRASTNDLLMLLSTEAIFAVLQTGVIT
jgi:purine-binding chemotaxis protein CheW